MSTEIQKNFPAPVVELRTRLDEWRRNRDGQRHMPRELWEAAVKLAKRYGISPVSAGLSLGYMSLKQKVHGNWGPVRKKSPAAGFVEMPRASIFAQPLGSANEVELYKPDGRRAVIRNASNECVLQVAREFLSQ